MSEGDSSSTIKCRACEAADVTEILDLGLQPLANNLLRPEDLEKQEPRFPLRLAVCPQCRMMQIIDEVPPVDLFSDYVYFSSFSPAWVEHAKKAAERYVEEFALGEESLVIEVASNDGYCLKNFVRLGVPCLGIEPAGNIAKVAEEKENVPTLVKFFNAKVAERLVAKGKSADLVLGNNVFAHVPTIRDFVAALKIVLKPTGSAILEFPYGVNMIDHREFDTIYHEHVFYFTLTALLPLFESQGMEIYHVEEHHFHGGSLRIFAAPKGVKAVQDSIAWMLEDEEKAGVPGDAYYNTFGERVDALRTELRQTLQDLKAQGKSIAAYGASAKGSTLLNYFGLGPDLLDFVADRSTYKQGKLSPGQHIPIVPPEKLVEAQPDYVLLLTWNFAEEILTQQQAYRDAGGQFIIPIPAIEIV